jgi:hypothetical protein
MRPFFLADHLPAALHEIRTLNTPPGLTFLHVIPATGTLSPSAKLLWLAAKASGQPAIAQRGGTIVAFGQQ